MHTLDMLLLLLLRIILAGGRIVDAYLGHAAVVAVENRPSRREDGRRSLTHHLFAIRPE
jgi:hypothetical protein